MLPQMLSWATIHQPHTERGVEFPYLVPLNTVPCGVTVGQQFDAFAVNIIPDNLCGPVGRRFHAVASSKLKGLGFSLKQNVRERELPAYYGLSAFRGKLA